MIGIYKITNYGKGYLQKGELNHSWGKKGVLNPRFGIKRTQEEIQKDIDASTCNIILLDTLNGIYYNSIKQASKELNINYNTLKSYISGRNRNKTNLIAV